MAYQPKSYRKFVAGTVTAAVVASALAPVASAAEKTFPDVPAGHEHAEAIYSLVEKGIIKGLPNGTFAPYAEITRAQAAIMMARVLPGEGKVEQVFEDVPVTADEELVKAAYEVFHAGVMTGSEGKLNIQGKITRQQMAKVLVETFGLERVEGKESKVKDLDLAFEGFREYIEILSENGVTVVENFNPRGNISRAAFASMVYRAQASTKETIENVVATTADEVTTVTADVRNAEKATVEVFANGDTTKDAAAKKEVEVKGGKISTSFEKLPAGKHVVRVTAGEAKKEAEFTVVAVNPEVTSVSAVNLKQVVVTFNKDVDSTTAGSTGNYTFASGSGVTVTAAEVNGKSVTLTVSGTSQQQSADLTVEGVKVADGTVVAKTTKSVKFVDAVAPVVSSVDAIGPKTIKVKFSEPLQSAPTFSLNDGTIAIVTTAFTAGSSEATLTLGTAPASGTLKLKVKDGLDYAGFKIDEVVKEFTFAVDTVAPVLTVKSASPTQIVLSSNEDFTGVADNNVEFFHTYNGVAAYKATKSVSGKEITLSFANPLPEGTFKLFLNYAVDNGTQIADLWGNKVAEQTLTGTVVSDTVAPTVTKVEVDGNTAFKVTFSEAVSGATTAANYEIKDASGNTVSVNGTITNVSGNTYSIPVAALNGGSYTLTVKNIKDTSINQNKLADYTTTVAIKDVVAPTITDLDTVTSGTQAQLLSSKKVKVVFSEAMDRASIENKLNYLFGGVALDSKVTVTAVDNNKAVILDFTDVTSGPQATPASATLQVLRVADAAGNPIAVASTNVLVPAGVTAPLFDKAEVTGKNTIKLYFKELITSAQAADFLVSNDNGSSYSAAGSISNEVVDGKSVITLTTSQDLPTTAANVLVKTTGSVSAKNGFGTAVSLNATSAADKYAPMATVATAIDNDGDTFVDRFTVQFSEALYVASVQDGDFTIEGYEITGVSVSGDTVTLTVKEKTTNDLAATPKVTLVGTVEDAARNARTGQDALTAVAAQVAIDAQALAASKLALGNAVTAAQAKHDGAAQGNYAVGSKATLQTAINAAKAVHDNAASTKAQLDQAKADLDAAVNAFEAGKVA
ncbi:S-layer homology domain-containing protein [Bacillus sp. CGMCC 1.16541]|uniref:S-layer homology domain-containing protein n=1 Tax=Bacillus sp. CGMCC 1.16541 TaxID=2185143 RepID=UPI000D72AADB|nr:S-layer homology domain-containing protein [Bacillus sp. CGMCC 1.16541]